MQKAGNINIPPNKSVAELCDIEDWTEHPIIFYAYLPFGLCIFIFRIIILTIFSLFIFPFPRNIKCRAFQVVLTLIGIHISCNLTFEQVKKHTQGTVVAMNHVSVFDFFILLIQPQATMILVHIAGWFSRFLGSFLQKVSGFEYWTITNKRELATHFAKWRENPEANSLYITPEGTINNGRGLFQFRHDFISRGFPVVPAALKIKTSLGISPHPVLASGAKKFLRLFMMPWMRFEVAFLEKRTRQKGQSKEEFAREIQQAIANHLGIIATNWTVEQKHAYIRTLNR